MPLAMLIKAWRHGSAKNGPQPKEPNAISYANKSVAESQRHSPAKKNGPQPEEPNAISYANRSMAESLQ